MIFSKHRRIDPKRRFGSKEFQSKIRDAKNYRRSFRPIDLARPSRWMVILGFRSRMFRIVWVGAICAFAYLFMFSDQLVISNVKVTGTNRVPSEKINEVIAGLADDRTFFIPKSNYFLLTKKQALENLANSLPLVKDIKTYHRGWPNRVEIEIVERDPGFILQVNDRQYLVDDEGVVVRSDVAGLNLPIVIDQVIENFDTGQPLPNTKLVAFLLSMYKQWPTKIQTPIVHAKIPGKASLEAQFVSTEGWAVFFDANRSVLSQLENLSLLLSKQIPARDRANLAYIDLRLEKWAYYCFKNTPCVAGASVPEQTETVDPKAGGAVEVKPPTDFQTKQ